MSPSVLLQVTFCSNSFSGVSGYLSALHSTFFGALQTLYPLALIFLNVSKSPSSGADPG